MKQPLHLLAILWLLVLTIVLGAIEHAWATLSLACAVIAILLLLDMPDEG